MKRIVALMSIMGLGMSAMTAQTFFSVNAGTDGFNFNVTNVPPLFPVVHVAPPPPPPPHRVVYAPLMPGVSYEDYGYYPSKKAYKKAAKHYKKAVKHAAKAWGAMVVGVPGYYYDYDDDDFYEEYYHHYKKHHKHKKHHKKHKHHHDD